MDVVTSHVVSPFPLYQLTVGSRADSREPYCRFGSEFEGLVHTFPGCQVLKPDLTVVLESGLPLMVDARIGLSSLKRY